MKAIVLTTSLSLAGLVVGLSQLSAAPGDAADHHPRASSGTIDRPLIAPRTRSRDAADTNIDSDASAQANGLGSGIGADIIYGSIYSIHQYALNPDADYYDPDDPIEAYMLGSRTCNIGDEPLLWQNNGTPGFAANAYRLHNGRLMQIGMSWVKHSCCVWNAQNSTVCGMSCSQTGSGSTLNPGCLDTYTATYNGNHNRLGPRTNINPFTGAFGSLPGTNPDLTVIDRRLQVRRSEMDSTTYSGALYFVEGVYVCTDSAQAGNWFNNASYRRVAVHPSTYEMVLQSQTFATIPAIFAWYDHGNGLNNPDEDVDVAAVDHPEEGRFYVATKVSDNGDDTWRYEYAVYNLNSDLSAGGFSVNIGSGATITNVGFHSPTYHSGEAQDNSPWDHQIVSDQVIWSTTETYSENPNANAIRWATMYNFWFDADAPPTEQLASVHTFKPSAIDEVTFTTSGPSEIAVECPADLNDDGEVDALDLLILLADWGECPGCDADLNNDDEVDALDLLILLADWGECP